MSTSEARDQQPDPVAETALTSTSNPCSLEIRNFVRPFTQSQVQAFVQQHGPFLPEGRGFWMNKIKSYCIITYASPEVAQKSREALDNQVWPAIGGQALVAEYSQVTATEHARAQGPREIDPRTASRRPLKRLKSTNPKKCPVALDDLYLKTQAEPVLYYLPLSPAEVYERQLRAKLQRCTRV